MEKCFEVQNPAEAADLSIAAVTAATTITVAATHFKNVCIKLGKINTLKISLKLFSEDVFFCWKPNQKYIPNFVYVINSSFFCYHFIM